MQTLAWSSLHWLLTCQTCVCDYLAWSNMLTVTHRCW